jgi:homoserine O-acetyltransferase
MSKKIPENSVGVVTPKTCHFGQPLTLVCGKTLPEYDLVYETYGELNAQSTNAVLICHALSGDHHAAGYHSETDDKPGWWDTCIGPGKPIDTKRFFVVSLNNLGGCNGSTGPKTINPETGPIWPSQNASVGIARTKIPVLCIKSKLI